MNALDVMTVTVSIRGIELLALKKLSLVSHALAQKLGSDEQKCLATTLDDLIRQIEINGRLA
jgi:hypothetical protein